MKGAPGDQSLVANNETTPGAAFGSCSRLLIARGKSWYWCSALGVPIEMARDLF
jgi:hypothetical protein